jgi:signal transduction histidine kinase/DNA-binding response OmpR family regulator
VKKSFLNYSDQNNLLPGNVVQALREDRDGNIWIGTASGLHCFDKGKRQILSFTTADGLCNDVICGICEDGDGNIWVSTYEGVSKFIRPESRFVNYFEPDGLQGNEFSRGAYFCEAGGKIYFGGVNGVTAFYPDEIIEGKRELDILLTNFYVSNRAVRKGDRSGKHVIVSTAVIDADEFRLSFEDNTFGFELSTLDFINPERIYYQYRMEGFNTEWINAPLGSNKIIYNNLEPGTYTFYVRACDNNNFSSPKAIRVVISPPWSRTWWAYCIYSFIVLGLIFAIVIYLVERARYRRKLMEKEYDEKISEAKLQFFINISHEIRTPMTLIINPLEKLMKDDGDKEKYSIYLMIYRNAHRILQLINQLMDIRKIDKGQMELHYKRVNIVKFIDDLMLTFDHQAKKKNIRFAFSHSCPDVLNVMVDPNNFDKVLLNIFSNAFKFTPEGGEIRVRLTADGEWFEISVTDTGTGIDKNSMEKIFERFYQADNSSIDGANTGTGIGLNLSRLLVELHKGVLYAENRTDIRGSRFIVRLPVGDDLLATESVEHADMAFDSTGHAGAIALLNDEKSDAAKSIRNKSRYRLLVVEDDDNIRDYLIDELSPDYRIRGTRNGREALDFVLKEKPDLVISDVIMPEMDGITLSRRIKQNININHIPVILLTARTETEDRIEGLSTGADAYLIKPFNINELRQTINNLIINRERLKNNYRGNQLQADKLERIELKSSDEALMERIMRFINENITNPELNVEVIADYIGMSRVHLHRRLKKLTNQSARNFIRGIRLRQAASLLGAKKITIAEAAYATGFRNLSHFSFSFREFYGVSPTEYVNKMRIENPAS